MLQPQKNVTEFFRRVFRRAATAAPMVECLSNVEAGGVKWMFEIPANLWTDELRTHAKDELRHSQLMGEQAMRLRSALSDTELRADQALTARCLEATDRYLAKLFGRMFRLVSKHGDPQANAVEFHVLLSLVVERRLMSIYPAMSLHGCNELLCATARELINDEKEHLTRVSDALNPALALVGLTFEQLVMLEARLADQWVASLGEILGLTPEPVEVPAPAPSPAVAAPAPQKTVLLFPGLDSLFLASKLKRWLDVGSTQGALAEASEHLSTLTGAKEDLTAFLRDNGRPHLADFDRTLVALTGLQVGIARGLAQKQPWDLVLGCSHGDIARSVICGMLDLKNAVEVLWLFADLRKRCPEGSTANVRTVDGSPLSPEQLQWLEGEGAPVSRWSDTNATIAADLATLTRIGEVAREHGLKVKPVLPYPVHSPVMKPVTDLVRAVAHKWEIHASQWPVFSSVRVGWLNGADDVREEALESSVKPVRWVDTLQHLRQNESVTHFVNVGPSNTLTGWLLDPVKFPGVKITDAWDVMQGAAA